VFFEGQRVAIGDSTVEARFVCVYDDERTAPPQAVVCFDDGTIDIVSTDQLNGL
jgi:hypothetical protein